MITVKRFTAPWCMPCKVLAPVFTGLEQAFPDVKFETIDVDEAPVMAINYNITTVPTVLIFKDEVFQEVVFGAQPRKVYVELLEKLTKSV